MRYLQSYATTQAADQFPDKLPDCPKSAGFWDCFKVNTQQNSLLSLIGGAVGIITGPWFGFQKKGFWKYLFYGGAILNILSGLWAASTTGWHFYVFSNKVI
jgi:hypothetical protein